MTIINIVYKMRVNSIDLVLCITTRSSCLYLLCRLLLRSFVELTLLSEIIFMFIIFNAFTYCYF